MGENKKKLTHKELLTFSNLTNLEWEFVKLELAGNNDNGDITREGEAEYKKLSDLLDPKLFVRYNSEKDLYSYPYLKEKYGKDIDFTDEEKEEGFKEMRIQAGIAMEYLEKLDKNEEADFLKDWEVIYAGDNYKVVADYVKNKKKKIFIQLQKLTNFT